MEWLLRLAEKYQSKLPREPSYKALALALKPEDIRCWKNQLYYQSRDFTSSAISLSDSQAAIE